MAWFRKKRIMSEDVIRARWERDELLASATDKAHEVDVLEDELLIQYLEAEQSRKKD